MLPICPCCGEAYADYPALSRLDNETEICPACGMSEALEDWETGTIRDWRATHAT